MWNSHQHKQPCNFCAIKRGWNNSRVAGNLIALFHRFCWSLRFTVRRMYLYCGSNTFEEFFVSSIQWMAIKICWNNIPIRIRETLHMCCPGKKQKVRDASLQRLQGMEFRKAVRTLLKANRFQTPTEEFPNMLRISNSLNSKSIENAFYGLLLR